MKGFQFWNGENLPPVDCCIAFKVASSDKIQFDRVSGYKIAPSLEDNDAYHRIFVQFEGGDSRLLKDVISMPKLLGNS